MNKEIIKVPFACGNKHLVEELTIQDLLNLSDNIISDAIEQIDIAIEKANLSKEDIDLIILAGGSSQLPGVKEKIYQLTGLMPCDIPRNLMLAVSYGATLYQREIFNLPKTKIEKRILGDSLGIMVDDGGKKDIKILLSHNETLPAKASHRFPVSEGQDRVTLNLVSLNDHSSINLKQRDLYLSKKTADIEVEITVDKNRIIILSAWPSDNPQNKSIIQCDSAILSDSQIGTKQNELGISVASSKITTSSQDCIGIDLGTTTSELTYCNRTGEPNLKELENPQFIRDKDLSYSKFCFPSVVFFRDGISNTEVANITAINNIGNSEGTCFSTFKIMDKFKPVGKVKGKNIMVRDLSALLLAKIWKSAQENLSIAPSSAVITVPAAFTSDECEDTFNAAKIAGIKNVSLIDEPTAAFYYYKYIQGIDTSNIRNVLVFDFGGGTTDVAILDVKQNKTDLNNPYKDCIYTVLATAGNTHCGGRNVDETLVNEICNRFKNKNGVDVEGQQMRQVRKAVESAKIKLSEEYRTNGGVV